MFLDPTKPQSTGDFSAKWLNGGFYLDANAIPFFKGGNLQLFSLDYKKGYYGSGGNPPLAKCERLPNGSLLYTAEYKTLIERSEFYAEQRIEVYQNNSIRFTLKTSWKGDFPLKLEWNTARIWAYPLINGKYETDRMNANANRISRVALPVGNVKNIIGIPFSNLSIESLSLGRVDFKLSSSPPLDLPTDSSARSIAKEEYILLDARNDPYLQSDKLFWLGLNGVELSPKSDRTFQIEFQWTPGNPSEDKSPSQAENFKRNETKIKLSNFRSSPPPKLVQDDVAGKPYIIPEPKHAVFDANDFQLRGKIPLTVAFPDTEDGKRADRASREFAQEMSGETGVKWEENSGAWKQKGLLVTVEGSVPLPHPLTPALTMQPEGYALVVTSKFVVVIGRDPAGAFYGLQTLRQLLRSNRGGHRLIGADISDWPSLKFRGAHIFVGKNALPFHKKLIERIFSRYKLNTLVIECEYTKWKSHPELHQSFSMEPEALREEVAFARDHFMEPIPLVNSLGHSEWIFKNGQHLDLAEDVTSPHAYDASNPNSYRFIFDIFSETIDIFKPKHFHIGHDEVKVPSYDLFGKYPARPDNIAKGATALFMEDTNRIADWLRERKIRTIMWADMLLHESEGDKNAWDSLSAANAPTLEEAQRRRALLPKDIIIADWRYHPGSEQRNGLEVLKSAGLDTLGCPWFEPDNIRGWAQQAISHDSLGILETTWAGYDSNEERLEDEYRQFTPFVLAGEYSWSGASKKPRHSPSNQTAFLVENELPYAQTDVFRRSYQPEAAVKSISGWFVILNSAVNATLNPDAQSNDAFVDFSGSRNQTPLAKISPLAQDTTLFLSGDKISGVLFKSRLMNELIFNDPKNNAPATTSVIVREPPTQMNISVGKTAARLKFLHSSLANAELNSQIAVYKIRYSDGSQVQIPVRYGREVRALDDKTPSSSYSAQLVTLDPKFGDAGLRQFEWRNPTPGIVIESIEISQTSQTAALILFAITGEN